MNLTLSVDERLARRARRKADAMGRLSTIWFAALSSVSLAGDDAERVVAEIRQLSRRPRGRVCGWRFIRDELHRRLRERQWPRSS
jgi:hypothetical protein